MVAPSSVTRTGKNEPWELQVSRGQITWHTPTVVFGYNADVDTVLETVWPRGGILSTPPSAVRLKVSSNNANDTSAGTGARTVSVGGLDENHAPVSEVVVLNGQTPVLTTKFFLHINHCEVQSSGSLNSAAGTIFFGDGTVTAGVPATIYDVIEYDYNIRLTGSYTIPAGYTGYLMQGMFATGQASGSTAITGRLTVRNGNDIRKTVAVVSINNGTADYSFEYPIAILETSTVEALAVGSAANNFCSSMFVILLIKNDAGTP